MIEVKFNIRPNDICLVSHEQCHPNRHWNKEKKRYGRDEQMESAGSDLWNKDNKEDTDLVNSRW